MDINNIKNFTIDLIPQSGDDGFLVEVGDSTTIKPLFEVIYSNEDERYGMICGKLRIKTSTSILDLKSLPEGFRKAVFYVRNKEISWEEAVDFRSEGSGDCFKNLTQKECWISTKPIAITLIKRKTHRLEQESGRGIREGCTFDVRTQTALINNISNDTIPSNDIIQKDIHEDTLKDIQMSLEITIKSVNEDLKGTQYLMSGREGESFFYEGSQSDKSGASFRVDYDVRSMKGEYDIIIDINNLRIINSGFRREVVKIINDGITLRSASGMITVEKGTMHFSKNDRVWFIDKPLVIKLLK